MISIIGFVMIIVAAVMAFKTAKQYERHAALWAAIVVGTGIAIQIVIPVIAVIAIGLIMLFSGYSLEEYEQAIMSPATIISVVCIFLSLGAMLLILKHLSKMPDEEGFSVPPKPPEFL